MAVPVHRGSGQQQRHGTEFEHRRGAVGDVADLLGEADDLHLEAGILVLAAQFFEQRVVGDVVDLVAVLVELGQLGDDHRTRLVTRDQGADETALPGRTLDAGDQFGGQLVRHHGTGNQRVGAKAFLGDFIDEAVRRPQGLHAEAIDARQVDHRLGHVVEALQTFLRPDRALLRLDHDVEAIGAKHVVAVFLESLDVFVAGRHLLFEAGFHAQLEGEVAHAGGKHGEPDQERRPEAEAEIFKTLEQPGQMPVDIIYAEKIDHGELFPAECLLLVWVKKGADPRPAPSCIRDCVKR